MFFAFGIPKGQPRPRAFARKFGNKWAARVYDSGTAECWKAQVAIAAQPHIPATSMTGPIHVELVFYFPRPKSHYRIGKHAGELRVDAPRFCTQKPDADNSAKAVLDALTLLGVWVDDSQVCKLVIEKFYPNIDEKTGCSISIYPISNI